MKNTTLILFVLLASVSAIWFLLFRFDTLLLSPIGKQKPKERPLLAYSFENLRYTKFPANQILLGRSTAETADTKSQLFYFSVPKKPNSSQMDTISGLMNIPKTPGTYPVIVMFRGYAPIEDYRSGVGTQRAGEVFARNGFITLAPDFLGYGESSSPSSELFEGRFQTYTTALTLFSSLSTLNEGLTTSYSGNIRADATRIGLWGHSNGGHIALSTLAISGVSFPTVLWAPVSKSFPYSILYYSDEVYDQGKSMRKALSSFEADYTAGHFSPASYYGWIKAPITIYQGTADQEVPVWWSDELTDILKSNKVNVYPFEIDLRNYVPMM